ncbi:MAG: signal peptidase II [Streptosporangiales bacterium]|nr:signal peptidase II [Streptosporangiales bacterium]
MPRRRIGVLVAVATLALAADAVTKVVAVATLSGRDPVRLLGGLLTLRLTRNSGAAFSIGTGMTWIFTLIAAGVAVYIVMKARELRSLPWAVTLGLILGGALGNLADRILRAPAPLHGHVVDWIELPNWPVFNLADSSIVCGGVLAVWLAFRGLNLDGTRTTDEDAPDADGSAAPSGSPESPGGIVDGSDGDPDGRAAGAERDSATDRASSGEDRR